MNARSHTETLNNPDLSNSCQSCHYQKNEDLKQLQRKYEILTQMPKPQCRMIPPVSREIIPKGQPGAVTVPPGTDRY